MPENTITRIAMWSGPRNISTAMMRAWENRADTFVTDEPFYAFYLAASGIDHPGKEEIITSQSTDWRQVARECTTLTHRDCRVHYQKHMTQHMLPQLDLDWINALHNIFLIRTPQEVVASYSKTRPDLTPQDLGFEQQHRLFMHVREHCDDHPLVIRAIDVLKNPTATLTAICDKCNLAFNQSMLKWPAGKRDSDGVWAPHWYHNVEQSTEFSAPAQRDITLNAKQQSIADQCEPFYAALREHTFTL